MKIQLYFFKAKLQKLKIKWNIAFKKVLEVLVILFQIGDVSILK